MTASTHTLSKQQQRALAQMGIDVWVRRGVAADAAAVSGKTPDPMSAVPELSEVSAAAVAAELPPTDAAPGPTVALDCLTAPGIVMVGEFADPLDRRIAQDIVLAVAGAAAPQRTAFRWPLTQTGDAGIAAARNAYSGFLRGQTERAGARWLLLLGAAATALLDAAAQSFDPATTELRTLRLPGAKQLRADPVAKRRLWLSVSHNDRS